MTRIGLGMLLGSYSTGVVNMLTGDTIKSTVVGIGGALLVLIWAQLIEARRARLDRFENDSRFDD